MIDRRLLAAYVVCRDDGVGGYAAEAIRSLYVSHPFLQRLHLQDR